MPGSWRALPSLFGLAPCGVYPAPAFADRAVRSYRTISPLPRRCASKLAQGGPHLGRQGVAEAVSFLWHWPSMSLEAHVPDVIRHTALRSSDFPPPVVSRLPLSLPAATARSSCQGLVYREWRWSAQARPGQKDRRQPYAAALPEWEGDFATAG